MEIHFEIENRCLLGCRHCSSKAANDGAIMEYSQESMVRFLNGIQGEKEVFLTGGEPLLYSEIETLFKRLHTEVEGLLLGMFTTGIREKDGFAEAVSESYAEQLVSLGLNICYFSIYSSKAEEHDWMTGYKGSFNLTRQSILNLKKAGVDVRFNSVVTAKNAEDISKIIRLAEEWGVSEVRLLKLIRHGRAELCWDHIGVTEEKYRQVVREIFEKDNSVRITASGAVDIAPCRHFSRRNICPAGKQLWYITYRGDVFPCASVKNNLKYRVGNIREDIIDKCELFHKCPNEKILCC